MKRRETEQLNTPPASEAYQLEDILREFGSVPQKSGVSDETAVFRPISPQDLQEEVKLARAPKKQRPPASKLSDETQRLPSLAELQKAGVKPAQAQSSAPSAPVSKASIKKHKSAKQRPTKRKAARPVTSASPPAPKTLLLKHQSGLIWLRLRVAFSGFLALAGLLLLIYQEQVLSLPTISGSGLAWARVLLLTVQLLLSRELIVRALSDTLHLRMGLHMPALIAAILAYIQAFQAGERPVYCAVVPILLFFFQLAALLEKSALVNTLRTVTSFDSPMGIFDTPQLLRSADSLRREAGNSTDFLQKLSLPDGPQKLQRVYAWLLLPASCALAYALSQRAQTDFVTAWLQLLLGGIPFSTILSYPWPFASLSKRLSLFGGALCGWHGAKVFGGEHTIILRDGDLFPAGSISSNGMKLFGAHKAPRIIAYALAALETIDSPLVSIFEALLQSQYGRHLHASSYRFYDDGGIGVEVAGDVVLVGSLSFMRAMGVHMPNGTRVRQAVYVSVNGELAGIFAMKYRPNASTRTGLHDILANRNFSVVLATRDFLITPELLSAKYELTAPNIQFPAFQERLRLSAEHPEESAKQGALIAKDTFGAFASTIAAGRTLHNTSLLTLWMSLFSGLLGFVLCALTIAWNAPVSPLHIAAFQLLWTIATAFVSWILLKF